MIKQVGKEKVIELYKRGEVEGCFQYVSNQEAEELLNNPHTFQFQQLTHNNNSESTKLRQIVNPSNMTKITG